ncbi:MAG: class I SAM-dependent methyltransferase [Rhodospirillales bacterium]
MFANFTPSSVHTNTMSDTHDLNAPAGWVRRHMNLIPNGGRVLDLAAGRGRHSRILLAAGHTVTAADRNVEGLSELAGQQRLEIVAVDLEAESWPFGMEEFAGIVVVNYLHRPLFGHLTDSLRDGGVLIYQTFAAGNEAYGRPKNPDFLLQPGELLDAFTPALTVIAYQHGIVQRPEPAVIQRLCAVKSAPPQTLAED